MTSPVPAVENISTNTDMRNLGVSTNLLMSEPTRINALTDNALRLQNWRELIEQLRYANCVVSLRSRRGRPAVATAGGRWRGESKKVKPKMNF